MQPVNDSHTGDFILDLQLTFEAALVLHRTSLRRDYPDVWRRYEKNTIIRYGHKTGRAKAYSQLGRCDMKIMCHYYKKWLSENANADKHQVQAVRWAVDALARAIKSAKV